MITCTKCGQRCSNCGEEYDIIEKGLVQLHAENTELRSIIADVLLYFVMPSGEKKRAIRERVAKLPERKP